MCSCVVDWKKNQERSVKPLIKISTFEDISKIEQNYLRGYIEKLLHSLLEEYEDYYTNKSLSSIGDIYYVESEAELENHLLFGLNNPITELSFDIIDDIGNGYVHGIIAVSNDFAISIFASNNVFNNYFERMK